MIAVAALVLVAAAVWATIAPGARPTAPGRTESSVIACDDFEVAGRIDCVNGDTGVVVVSFDADLECPEEDSCRLDYRDDRWTITRATP